MSRSSIWLYLCPSCEAGLALDLGITDVECARCRYRNRQPAGQRFGEGEWDAERAPTTLVGCLSVLDVSLTLRKRRLICTATTRIGFNLSQNVKFLRAVEAAEDWADVGQPPFRVDALRHFLRRRMPRRENQGWDYRQLCLESLADHPSLAWYNYGEVTQQVLTDAYRELVPNPFVLVDWNRNWVTSTVRDLVAHVYEQRAFELMPILGDALMDAGCDHPLILDHCRSSKPHARGCFVVDAILGKT